MQPTVAAIIPAAGSGRRMDLEKPKQFVLLAGQPVLVHSVQALTSHPRVGQVVVVAPADWLDETKAILIKHGLDSPHLAVIPGGRRRQDSVLAGLRQLSPEPDIVLVHDGARPLVNKAIIDRCCDAAWQYGAAIAAIPVKDTLKRQDSQQLVAATIDRDQLWQAQTPQAARFNLLLQAFAAAGDSDVTDEAMLLERAGTAVALVAGSETNIKITRPEDLQHAEQLLRPAAPLVRTGHGYDAHRLVAGRPLVLGGVAIPHPLGLAGHSDADVVTHALCDALLGALGRGDIGRHFPDSSAEFAGIYSIRLLERVVAMMVDSGWILGNSDLTIVCQAPRLAPWLAQMQQTLSLACQIESAAINIKATTTEGMGFCGRGEGIGCHAVVLLQQTRIPS